MHSQSPNDIFSYGDVSLVFALTKQFVQTPDTEPSGTDQIWTRTRLTVRGVFDFSTVPTYAGQTIQQTLQNLEHRLLAFRQRLRYRLGGVTVLAVDPNNQSPLAFTPDDTIIGPGIMVDCENGPKPISVSFPLVLPGSCEVEFIIECCFVNCPGGAAQIQGYASNRFSTSEDYDQLGYREITTQGVLIGRSDLVDTPDQLRGTVVPRVPNGHQRMRSKYILSEDGLRLSYYFVDKEYHLGPPAPAKKASAVFLIASNSVGANFIGQCNVKLEAGKDVAKRDLMNLAVLVARSRLALYSQPSYDANGNIIPNQIPALQSTYVTQLYENVVEVIFKCRLDPSKIQQADLKPNDPGFQQQVSFGAFDSPLPGSPAQNQWGIAPSIRGFQCLPAMIAQVFEDPCMSTAILVSQGPPPTVGGQPLPPTTYQDPTTQTLTGYPGAQFNPFPPGGLNVASITVGPVPLVPPPIATTASLPYEFYHIRVGYRNDSGKRAMDSTGKDSSGNALPRPVVQLRNPRTDITVTWTAQRVGDPPEIPDPCPASTNFNLTNWNIETEEPQMMSSGSYKHTISGHYEYNVLNPCILPLIEAVPPFLIPVLSGSQNPLSPPTSVTPTSPLPGPGPTSVDGLGSVILQNIQALLQKQDTSPSDLGSSFSPPPPPPPSPVTGNMAPFNTRQDIVWWRMMTVPPSGIFCGCGTPTNTFTFELTSGGAGVPSLPAAGIPSPN